ncbi:chaps-domain-containing protein [Clavulina sp. PMI_390]|nr:chaps-domain-containing protein [Clavulina sp. PMI_390]
MADVLRDIPEFFEVDKDEALLARTETLSSFRELGPPDLCHIVKKNTKNQVPDISSYHYVSGVDASSSASLAAYINSLTYAVEEQPTWFSKAAVYKVRGGTYCCFNAFSRVDVRVDVKIPGGVRAYVVDPRGERHDDPSPEIWQETYLSALLRSILYADDPNYSLQGYRKLAPIVNTDDELRFLQAAELLFSKGWQLGSEPEIQVASIVSNHLTSGIMKYFGDSYRMEKAANLFERVSQREPDVASLLAQSYVGMNNEVKAVQIMAAAIRENPQSYTLLHAQCDLLKTKGKMEWALQLAKQAVNCAPSEFTTWAKLTELYTELGRFDSALLTLNSCPMFTYNERDLHRMPTPAKTHLPIKQFITDSRILDDYAPQDLEADPALLRLPAPALRGTFSRAYSLLTALVSHIGWDELLKTRSEVFVMEEEYRMQKAQAETGPKSAELVNDAADGGMVIHEDGTVEQRGSMPNGAGNGAPMMADENASTRALVGERLSSSMDASASVDESVSPAAATPASQAVPDPDAETETEVEQSTLDSATVGDEFDDAATDTEDQDLDAFNKEPKPTLSVSTAANGNGHPPSMGDDASNLGSAVERPSLAAVKEEDGEEAADGATGAGAGEGVAAHAQDYSFTNKRLCERWLDNLFMVLYEDLRIWTIFRAEIAHFKTQHVSYRKTGPEWEILADLGLRLHHKEEAKEAFQKCLDQKFSARAWMKLLEMYAEEGDLSRSLNAVIRLSAHQQRWYNESAYPTAIAKHLFKLTQTHGFAKIRNTISSMGMPQPITNVVLGYLDYGTTFKVEGYDF